MNIIQRVKAPTPPFFKKLRNTGMALASIGMSVLAAPLSAKSILTTIAGYVTLAGSVVSMVSQSAVKFPVVKSKRKRK